MIQSEPRAALDATARHCYARTNAVEHAHFERCAKFRKWHLWLGCITISCTAVLGVIADKHMTGPSWFQHLHDHLLPLLSVVAPILAGLVSFLRLDEKSTLHHSAGARFASMKRELDVMIANCTSECDIDRVRRDLRTICEKWDALTTQAPALYASEWANIVKKIAESEEEIEKYHPRRDIESDGSMHLDSIRPLPVHQPGAGPHRGLAAIHD
jgi:hypothetical protein